MKKVLQPLSLKNAKNHRREDCHHYEACLDQASALLWPSFSCEGCKLFIAKQSKAVIYKKAASPLAWEI